MKHHVRRIAGVAILLSAVAASGQLLQQVQATVPFSFVVGGINSPAGDYRIEVNHERNLITLRSEGLKPIMLFTTEGPNSGDNRSFLRFHRYADHWFLQEVTTNGEAQDLHIGKVVKEFMAQERSTNSAPLIADIAVH